MREILIGAALAIAFGFYGVTEVIGTTQERVIALQDEVAGLKSELAGVRDQLDLLRRERGR